MASSNPTPIFLTTNFGCEVPIGSFARFILPGSVHVKLSPTELRTGDHLKTILIPSFQKKYPEGFKLYMFGDFFTELFIAEALEGVDELLGIWLYTFDKQTRLVETRPGLKPIWFIHDDGSEGPDPFDAVLEFAKEHREMTKVDEFALKQHAEFIRLLNDRALGNNAGESQVLFTGIQESSADEGVEIDEMIYRVFCGSVEFNKLMGDGSRIIKNQLNIVRQRVLKNTRKGVTSGGTTYVVTEASELINLTHEQLKKMFPEIQMTICIRIVFEDGRPDRVAHSIQVWDDNKSAKRIIGKRGGGSDTAAGGSVEVDVKIDY